MLEYKCRKITDPGYALKDKHSKNACVDLGLGSRIGEVVTLPDNFLGRSPSTLRKTGKTENPNIE